MALIPAVALPCLGLFDPPHGDTLRPRADAALVLSGDVDYLRVQKASGLLREGSVSAILLTGAGVGGDSAISLRRVAIQLGVPDAAIRLESRSTTTRENLLFAAPTITSEHWTRVALVTSASHLGRAERVAKKVLPGVVWLPVAVPDPGPSERLYRERVQEWAKLAWYALRGWI